MSLRPLHILWLTLLPPSCVGNTKANVDLFEGEDSVTTPADDTDQATDSDTGSDSDSGSVKPTNDADGDGHDDIAMGGDDCDDTNPTIHPDAFDWAGGVDGNWDGVTDEEAWDPCPAPCPHQMQTASFQAAAPAIRLDLPSRQPVTPTQTALTTSCWEVPVPPREQGSAACFMAANRTFPDRSHLR